MKRFDAVPDEVFCNVQGAGARGGVVALVSVYSTFIPVRGTLDYHCP
jgi:hypothetical protein